MQDAPLEPPTEREAAFAESVSYEVAANIIRDLADLENISDIDFLRAVRCVVTAVL